MKKKNTSYQPIDCNFYDKVVLLIMRKQKVKIRFQNEQKEEKEIETTLKDVYAKEGEEFITLENGDRIRLDRLLQMDGKAFVATLQCNVRNDRS